MNHASEPWSSDKGHPPRFTMLANGVIEHLLERGYYLCAYWFSAHYRGPRVTIDVSAPHAIFPEFPGPTLGRVDCGPDPTELELSRVGGTDKLCLDAADPKSFDMIDDYFLTASGRRGPSDSASTHPA